MSRYVIVGAGAVGGALGGVLALAGHDITLVARGAHLEALRARGLTLVTPDATHVVRLPAVERASDVDLAGCEAVVVATKSQDTAAALAPIADTRVPIVCAQNGVANERFASERFEHVVGMVVFAPLQHLEPGVVSVHTAPRHGGLDIGRWPSGDASPRLEADLRASGFDVRARSDIARWKYGKLLSNLGNALEAIGGRAAMKREWLDALNEEAEVCLRAAGIAHVSLAEIFERFEGIHELGARGGGSTWQSLARGQSLETDFLNGEIVRLGRAHDVATPWNEALVALAHRAETEHWTAGARTLDELDAWLTAATRAEA